MSVLTLKELQVTSQFTKSRAADEQINKKDIEMELDTGSAVSLVLQKMFAQLWPKTPLEASCRYHPHDQDILGRTNQNFS